MCFLPCSSVDYRLRERQHPCHVTHVGLMHGHRTTQLALVLDGLLGQDVTLEGFGPRLTVLIRTNNARKRFFARCSLVFILAHVNSVACAREVCTPLCKPVGPEPLFQTAGLPCRAAMLARLPSAGVIPAAALQTLLATLQSPLHPPRLGLGF